MKYRHSFHAGNFADVHKHVTLLALLAALQQKDSGFLYLETHAGTRLYDLAHPETDAARAAQHASPRLTAAAPVAAELQHYLEELGRLRALPPQSRGLSGLAACRLPRSCERRIARCCFEIVPSEARALERALHGYPRACMWRRATALARLRAFLPPRERRCLVLIDPPYEERARLRGRRDGVPGGAAPAQLRGHRGVVSDQGCARDERLARALGGHFRVRQRGRRMVALSARFARGAERLGPADPESAVPVCLPHALLARRAARQIPKRGAGGVSVRSLSEQL